MVLGKVPVDFTWTLMGSKSWRVGFLWFFFFGTFFISPPVKGVWGKADGLLPDRGVPRYRPCPLPSAPLIRAPTAGTAAGLGRAGRRRCAPAGSCSAWSRPPALPLPCPALREGCAGSQSCAQGLVSAGRVPCRTAGHCSVFRSTGCDDCFHALEVMEKPLWLSCVTGESDQQKCRSNQLCCGTGLGAALRHSLHGPRKRVRGIPAPGDLPSGGACRVFWGSGASAASGSRWWERTALYQGGGGRYGLEMQRLS